MVENKINYLKKLAKLRYRDEILQLHKNGLSLSEITKKINRRLAHTELNTKLSRSTIHKIIKKYTEDKHWK